MMITKLNENIKEIVDQDNRLRHYLESLTVKADFTPRSWLYDGKNGNPFLNPEEILNKWVAIMKQKLLVNGNPVADEGSSREALPEAAILSRIYQFDTSQLEKWGPQGGHAPMEELLDDIVLPSFKRGESHDIPEAFVANASRKKDGTLKDRSPKYKQMWEQAKSIVIDAFQKAVGKEVLRPAAYKSVVDDMRARDTLESNSGFPMFARRNLPEVISQAVSAAENGDWLLFPAIALFRTYNGKTRLVWMYPMSTNLVEGSFFQPLQSAIMNAKDVWVNTPRHQHAFSFKHFFSPWEGFEAVREVVTNAYDNGIGVYMAHESYEWRSTCIAASDFSATDEHFQRWSTLEVYDVIKHCFQRQYWDSLKQSLLHMHEIPLVIGPDQMIVGWHGVSSGSNWTNFVETVFDMIFSVYASLCSGKVSVRSVEACDLFPLYAIGDDQAYKFAFFAPRRGDETEQAAWASTFVKKLLETTGQRVGQEIKAEKTTADFWQVKTLQRLFIRNYRRSDGQLRGVYSTIRALKSSVYPERFHAPSKWSSDMFCARQFMILENCVDHPLFNEFVEFICKGNRHLIPFAKKSTSELDAIQRKTKLIPGLNSTYNQEKRDESLASFESIRIAREL